MMKRILLSLAITLGMANGAAAQEIYNEVRSSAQTAVQTSSNSLVKQINQFKLDALDYLLIKMREQLRLHHGLSRQTGIRPERLYILLPPANREHRHHAESAAGEDIAAVYGRINIQSAVQRPRPRTDPGLLHRQQVPHALLSGHRLAPSLCRRGGGNEENKEVENV